MPRSQRERGTTPIDAGGRRIGAQRKRKRYGGRPEMHMDRGVSYKDTHQGYYSDAGKPSGSYGKPPNTYLDQQGMPNARKKKNMDYMQGYYSQGSGPPGGEKIYGGVSTSTNAGSSPNEASGDSTYTPGQATIGAPGGNMKGQGGGKKKKRKKYG